MQNQLILLWITSRLFFFLKAGQGQIEEAEVEEEEEVERENEIPQTSKARDRGGSKSRNVSNVLVNETD